MDLSEFLLARIAEDEAVARSAEPGPWTADGGEVWAGHPSHSVVDYARGGGGTADHIARHDPARVLAECDAKRRIVALAEDAEDLDNTVWADRGLSSDPGYNDPRCGERILRALALPYADHPDYDPAWRP